MKTEFVDYVADGITCEGFLASPDGPGPFPGVLVCHAWKGQAEYEREKAKALARLGYVAFCADVYGKGNRATDTEGAQALMNPLAGDRTGALARRLAGSLQALKAQPGVDAGRLGAIGFCFGGLCVLDMVRAGAELRGVVAFHAILGGVEFDAEPTASVLACQGWEDPMADPEAIRAFGDEMTDLGVDWQVHAYGNTHHAFTTPGANDDELGLHYDERADRRSWRAMRGFLSEVFSVQ